MSDTARDQAFAQARSVCAMVAALDCDYERLEELREKASAGHYVAGWNMPGYMPDSEPFAFDDADDAREQIAGSMREEASDIEEDDEASEEEKQTAQALREAADALEASDAESQAAEFGATIGRFHYWIAYHPGLSDEGEAAELRELEEAANDCASEDEARERIQEDALSVEVRSSWCNPGETMEAAEFRIVLCTGGPHVEIRGEVDRGSISRVRICYSDWGDSGEICDFDHSAVERYCEQFYFGE